MTTTHPAMKCLSALWLAAGLLALFPAVSHAADLKLEAVLVWGTNDEKPLSGELKPVTEDIAKKLNCLPFKYTNYFEVNRKQFSVKDAGSEKVRMSKDCVITVKNLEGGKVEVTLIGKGQPVGTITQQLKKGKCLVTGGNAANSTAWFVVLKQVD